MNLVYFGKAFINLGGIAILLAPGFGAGFFILNNYTEGIKGIEKEE